MVEIRPAQVSIIVTTYNRPDSLLWVLNALSAQDVKGFQVFIADDGSKPQTRIQVEQHAWPYVLHYIWQTDAGFRAATVRNLALKQVNTEYVIFLDGDSVPATDFVRRHCDLAERGYFVAGQRILCSPSFTQTVLQNRLPLWQYNFTKGLQLYLNRDINHLLALIHLPDGFWRKYKQTWQGAMSCNLAVWREDLIAINGFEQRYQGWGHEDADLVVRLLRYGVKRKQGRCATAVFHLWHQENDRSQTAHNQQRLAELIQAQRIRAIDGYQSALSD